MNFSAARTRVLRFMTSTVEVIGEGEEVVDPQGGRTRPPVVLATYRCRVVTDTRTPGEGPEGGTIVGRGFYKVALPWDAVVSIDQTVRIDGGPILSVVASNALETDRVELMLNCQENT